MDKMSGSPSLNPASTPFFPGGGGHPKEDDAKAFGAMLHRHNSRERFRVSSSLSVSPSDYRSVKSSPSPPQDGHDHRLDPSGEYHLPAELSRRSPANVQIDNDKPFAMSQRPIVRESSMSAIMEVPPEGDDHAVSPTVNGSYPQTLYSSMIGRMRERLTTTPPVSVEMSSSLNSRTPSFNSAQTHFISSSPASSLDSGSMFASSVDISTSFDAQLRSSPLIREMLERVDLLEKTTRDIQRTIGDVDRKMTILIERSITANSPPEFRDPFASSGTPSFAASNTNGLNSHRGSIIGNVAPNQPAPPEEISVLSHQMNALTTSIDHFLATQHAQGSNGALQAAQILGSSPQSNDLISTRSSGVITPNGGPIGIGIPSRGGPRLPGPPMRTWSAGTLDIPMRSSEQLVGSLGRADSSFRDKRRSVSTLLRRDSSATDMSTASRDSNGPIITKWEQLSLAPELLRSLNAFGVGPPNKIQQRALPFLLRGADIIAQAPPTQERIAAYVIPAIHIAVTHAANRGQLRGPIVVMISTTVDQATQAQRMIRDLGGPIGVRSALGVGASSANSDLSQELRLLHQNMPHILCGTPQKLHALFTSPGGISGSEVRFLVLDEVDQLIARNLQDFVFNIVRQLPAPRSRPLGSTTPLLGQSNGSSMYSMFEGNGSTSSLNTPSTTINARRFSTITSSPPDISNGTPPPIDRQTALFSNTVPQDVLNLATAIQLREPVRVLVRRDGNVSHTDSGQNARGLRQFYLYLAFTAGGGRSDAALPTGGTGIIGSGRGASSAESAQAREWKLDALADLFEDLDITQAIIHVGGMTSLEMVVYKLANRGLEPVPLHNDMNAGTKLAALNKFRNPSTGLMRQSSSKVLVVYDVIVKPPDVPQVPLVINYDLPKAVEEYAHRVAPGMAASFSRPGVVVNFVTATGGDVEMLRSIECFYKIKCPEVPMSLRDLL